MLAEAVSKTLVDPRSGAVFAGLVYVCPDQPGIGRRRAGKGFAYSGPDGARVTDGETLRRIRALAIPPAWKNVWICTEAGGHIQVVGRDDLGRRQYLYHPRFRELREGVKFDHMLSFAEVLPQVRRQVAADMHAAGLGRDKVLATVVRLLETTMIRVGNRAYAEDNKSYGLTTLRGRHVHVDGGQLKFHFKGKSGRVWRLDVRDRRVAKIVKACQELPGQHLFRYLDEDGEPQSISSADINAYLKRVGGRDITAKDFRTWTGTLLAAVALAEVGHADTKAQAKKSLTRVIQQVAARLGNTPSICRKCYVHPEVMNAYLAGELRLDLEGAAGAGEDDQQGDPNPEETAVLDFLRHRLNGPGAVIQGPWSAENRPSSGDSHG